MRFQHGGRRHSARMQVSSGRWGRGGAGAATRWRAALAGWLVTVAGFLAPAAMLEDDFDGTALREDLWRTYQPFPNSQVGLSTNASVRFNRRGGLQALGELPVAFDLTGAVRFVAGSDRLTIVWRSDLTQTNLAELLGLQAVLSLVDRRVFLTLPFVRNLGTNGFGFRQGTSYPFRITDDGQRVRVYVDDLQHPRITAETDHRRGRRWALYDSLDPDASLEIESIRVRELRPAIFVGGELVDEGPVTRDAPVEVHLEATLPGGALFYTTDGSIPTFANGREYREGFLVASNVVLRAVEYSADFLQSRLSPTVSLQIRGGGAHELRTPVAGGGRVELDPPGGSYTHGAVVGLRAVADPDWEFVRWEGDLDGTNAVAEVVLTGAREVRAVFGTRIVVTNIPENSARAEFESAGGRATFGERVTLTAIPEAGFAFFRWAGAVSGSDPVADLVVTNGRPGVTLLAVALGTEDVALVRRVEGTGRITVEPSGNAFARGTRLTLRAVPDPLWRFAGWGGGFAGREHPLEVTVTDTLTVAARFEYVGMRVDPATLAIGTGGFTLGVLSLPGRALQIEASTNLIGWTPILQLTNATGSLLFRDTMPDGDPWRFYRAKDVEAAAEAALPDP